MDRAVFLAVLLINEINSQVSLGRFVYNGHGLGGEVIVLNDRQYRIKGFSYDGGGPAVWHTGMRKGTVGVYSEDAYSFRNEENSCNRLTKRYSGKDVVITIPSNLSITRDIESIAVYCYRFCHNFGHVKVPKGLKVPRAPNGIGEFKGCKPDQPTCSRDRTRDNGVCKDRSGGMQTCPAGQSSTSRRRNPFRLNSPSRFLSTPRTIGRFTSYANGVTGEVTILNDRQFRVKGFTYSGARGSSTYFLVMEKGVAGVFNVKGFAVPDETGKCGGLRSYRSGDIVVTVPEEISLNNVGAIAVYDYEKCSNFGHVAVPDNLSVPSARSRSLPRGRNVCLPYFRPCSRRDTTNNGVCEKRRGGEFTC